MLDAEGRVDALEPLKHPRSISEIPPDSCVGARGTEKVCGGVEGTGAAGRGDSARRRNSPDRVEIVTCAAPDSHYASRSAGLAHSGRDGGIHGWGKMGRGPLQVVVGVASTYSQ